MRELNWENWTLEELLVLKRELENQKRFGDLREVEREIKKRKEEGK